MKNTKSRVQNHSMYNIRMLETSVIEWKRRREKGAVILFAQHTLGSHYC